MPKVTIVRSWPDEDDLAVVIETEPGHPDGLLTETARVALSTYAEALGVTLAVSEEDQT